MDDDPRCLGAYFRSFSESICPRVTLSSWVAYPPRKGLLAGWPYLRPALESTHPQVTLSELVWSGQCYFSGVTTRLLLLLAGLGVY